MNLRSLEFDIQQLVSGIWYLVSVNLRESTPKTQVRHRPPSPTMTNHATITPAPPVKVKLSGPHNTSCNGLKPLLSECNHATEAPVTNTRVSKVKTLIGLFSSCEKNNNYSVNSKRQNTKCALPSRSLTGMVVSVLFRPSMHVLAFFVWGFMNYKHEVLSTLIDSSSSLGHSKLSYLASSQSLQLR